MPVTVSEYEKIQGIFVDDLSFKTFAIVKKVIQTCNILLTDFNSI